MRLPPIFYFSLYLQQIWGQNSKSLNLKRDLTPNHKEKGKNLGNDSPRRGILLHWCMVHSGTDMKVFFKRINNSGKIKKL
jgi:hypothetical protein